MSDHNCSCGCGTSVESDGDMSVSAGCGCGGGGTGAITRGATSKEEEIARLVEAWHTIQQRLAEIRGEAASRRG